MLQDYFCIGLFAELSSMNYFEYSPYEVLNMFIHNMFTTFTRSKLSYLTFWTPWSRLILSSTYFSAFVITKFPFGHHYIFISSSLN